MSELEIDKIGLKVGLEIHQQLDTKKKLFCNCKSVENTEYTGKFTRKLRASKSELGKIDPAALFESSKSKTMVYYENQNSNCLVEKDEEPPHNLDVKAKEIVLLVSSALNSKIFSEIHVMRKTVIDGSNTSGFQRTMLVAQGGNIEIKGIKVGVQSICLEEDAAKLIKDENDYRFFSLDRLGVPLIEIALEPVSCNPKMVKEIALSLGRLLRVTKKVARGIGTIRQDVNVSIDSGGVVEIKGVQQLEQLEKIIEYEAKRQHGLKLISEKINSISRKEIDQKDDVFLITNLLQNCNSKIIKKSLENGDVIKAIKVGKFAGLFGFEPYSGIRLGKEIGQLVRFFGIGGVFHSDELPNYGIENNDIQNIRKYLELEEDDAFLIIAGKNPALEHAINSIINRIKDAKNGPLAETRAATSNDETIFLRPRPGPSRMYPETDIPTIKVSKDELEVAKSNIPKSWDESILEIKNKYKLNQQLTEQIFDSEYFDLFEENCKNNKNSPNFIASVLCSTIVNLQRNGLDSSLLKHEEISNTFDLLNSNKISKESVEIIFEQIMSGKAISASEAVKNASIRNMSEDELNKILDMIILNNSDKIQQDGIRSLTSLMGIAMKQVRGQASGNLVNTLLLRKINKLLEK
uniref:Glutamyl-tRNA(Gln) amidotransferase subunit E n=1 Tax=uncultured marine thaumarchaeote KM3_88_E12 TaxID=1456336 RepID=A0A075HZW2_9ARCH|nr:glutamyl-tRNA(Gln) amidotransferase subunit E (gatE) [uncultured marine thaumarchaeote KM3_88_E12]